VIFIRQARSWGWSWPR